MPYAIVFTPPSGSTEMLSRFPSDQWQIDKEAPACSNVEQHTVDAWKAAGQLTCIVERAFPEPGRAAILASQLMVTAPDLPVLQLERNPGHDTQPTSPGLMMLIMTTDGVDITYGAQVVIFPWHAAYTWAQCSMPCKVWCSGIPWGAEKAVIRV